MSFRDSPFHAAHPEGERLAVLQGKTAIVTGAGTGIGREVALLFAKEGANVIVADKDSAAGEQTVAAIEAARGRACFYPGDQADPQYHVGLAAFARHRYGWLDIAVNTVAIQSPATPLAGLSLAAWDDITAANLSSLFYAVRAQIPVMIEAGGGTIVNLAGIAETDAPPAIGACCASSPGMIALTRGVAADYAGQSIRANAIVPGPVDAAAGMFHLDGDQARRATRATMERLGKTAEIAEIALFLASPRSGGITGICVPINGAASRK